MRTDRSFLLVQLIFENSDAMIKLQELKNRDQGLWETIKQHIQALLDKVRAMLANIKSTSPEGVALQQMTDVLEQAHAMFEDMVVDAANTYQQTGGETLADGDVQYKKSFAKKRKTRYNEFNTNAMIWAKGTKTKPGDLKIINDRGKGFVLLEATEDWYIELSRGNYERIQSEYERAYTESIAENNECFEEYGANQGRDIWDMQLFEDGGNGGGNASSSEGNELQSNAERNDEYLLPSNQRKSIEFQKKQNRSLSTTFYGAMADMVSQETTELYDRLSEAVDDYYAVERAVSTERDPSAIFDGSKFTYADGERIAKENDGATWVKKFEHMGPRERENRFIINKK